MTIPKTTGDSPNRPDTYAIRIKGHLDARWHTRFEGMAIAMTDDGNTLLSGPIVDQAALHGLLKTVRNLGLQLLAVQRIERTTPD